MSCLLIVVLMLNLTLGQCYLAPLNPRPYDNHDVEDARSVNEFVTQMQMILALQLFHHFREVCKKS